MKLAVLSDIHDHLHHLDAALRALAGCDAMICCGDLCSPFVLDYLARGFSGPLHIVFGNNDADTFRITSKAAHHPHVRLRGEFFEEEFGGRRIAVNHFDNIARAVARAGHHDAVFFGHNHVAEIGTEGRTLLLNPGSVMGCQFDAQTRPVLVAPTCAIYDCGAGTANLLTLA